MPKNPPENDPPKITPNPVKGPSDLKRNDVESWDEMAGEKTPYLQNDSLDGPRP
ncbi:MAG: hypothetical protein QMC81_03660 [Thermoanaerobacterales bacterium]|nr:hypothetical protein [Bacillota bacterium]MDI6906577.1 hypothetical protein [Thermoanaerobacterales bacterium]